MSFFRHICLTLAFLSGALMAAGDAYAAPASAPAADPAAQLEALLDEHPELILNVLKKHSEEVLDIVQMGSDKRRRTVLLEQWKKDINEPKQVAVQGRPAGGPDNAPVTIIAFSDFVCAYCHQAAYTVGNLMKRYPGKIRLIFKQIPKTESGRMARPSLTIRSMMPSRRASGVLCLSSILLLKPHLKKTYLPSMHRSSTSIMSTRM